jgi:hypothetical protein
MFSIAAYQIDHFRIDHPNIPTPRWQVLDDDQARQIKVAERVSEDHKLYAWYCKICVLPTTKGPKHLRNNRRSSSDHVRYLRPSFLIGANRVVRHQKDQLVLGVDFARHPRISRLGHRSLLFGDPELLVKKRKEHPPKSPKPSKCTVCINQVEWVRKWGCTNIMSQVMDPFPMVNDILMILSRYGIANPLMGTELTEPSMGPRRST